MAEPALGSGSLPTAVGELLEAAHALAAVATVPGYGEPARHYARQAAAALGVITAETSEGPRP